jgi:hypothetical protein
MLKMWRLRRYREPLRDDCSVTHTDGLDTDRLLTMEMREWYINLLDTADTRLLDITDIAADVALKANSDGSATVALPAECRRVVEVNIDGWKRPATITPADTHLASLQLSEMSRGGAADPVAVARPGSLTLYTPPSAQSKLTSLKCIAEPADGSYRFDELALSLIPAAV